jgi:preprotein translocase subunit SecF
LFIAFILVAAVVFILFREVVPSFAVLQAVVFDIIVALAGMSVFSIPLTLPTIAALLLMIGYSVDTDILVTERVLKRKEGGVRERAYGAFITGLTVTGTTLTVVTILALFSYFNQMTTIFQIASVLLFGLLGDLPATWFTNTVLITWWAEHKKK